MGEDQKVSTLGYGVDDAILDVDPITVMGFGTDMRIITLGYAPAEDDGDEDAGRPRHLRKGGSSAGRTKDATSWRWQAPERRELPIIVRARLVGLGASDHVGPWGSAIAVPGPSVCIRSRLLEHASGGRSPSAAVRLSALVSRVAGSKQKDAGLIRIRLVRTSRRKR